MGLRVKSPSCSRLAEELMPHVTASWGGHRCHRLLQKKQGGLELQGQVGGDSPGDRDSTLGVPLCWDPHQWAGGAVGACLALTGLHPPLVALAVVTAMSPPAG